MPVSSFEIVSVRGLALSDIRQKPWGRYATFSDPDGNGWILRQPLGRPPGKPAW